MNKSCAREASAELLIQSVCKDHLEAFSLPGKVYDYATDPLPKLIYCFPYCINLARPLVKGFEWLRPGVIGFSQARA